MYITINWLIDHTFWGVDAQRYRIVTKVCSERQKKTLKPQNNNVQTKKKCDNQLFLKVFGWKVPDIKKKTKNLCLIEKEFDRAWVTLLILASSPGISGSFLELTLHNVSTNSSFIESVTIWLNDLITFLKS